MYLPLHLPLHLPLISHAISLCISHRMQVRRFVVSLPDGRYGSYTSVVDELDVSIGRAKAP